nr:MAG TPA: hypothetical protein [Caudoviricetes sp.]
MFRGHLNEKKTALAETVIYRFLYTKMIHF